MGFARGEDEELRGSIEGGGVSDGEEGGKGGGASSATAPTPPPQAKPQPNPRQPAQRNEGSPSSPGRRVTTRESPVAKSPNPPPPPPPHGLRRLSPPPSSPTPPRPPPPTPPTPTKTDTPKAGGATAEKKDDRADDPIVGTVARVPYPAGLEKGTVRAVHGQKRGAVCVEYPGGNTLYEMAWHLLFPIPEEAERYWEEARWSKKKPQSPAPTNEETNLPNPNPTTELTSR